MKKIIALIMAVMMVMTLGLSSFAATINQETAEPKTADTIVKTTLEGSTMPTTGTYEITIPATTTIIWGTETDVDLNYSVNSQLALGASLAVSVADAENDAERMLRNDAYTAGGLAYTATGFEAQSFGELNSNEAPATAVTINIADWSQVPVAEYDTTLTYTVVYTPAP